MTEWSVRDETAKTETGFGSNESIAVATYEAMVEKARVTGMGGSFALKRDGKVVVSVTVPGRGGKG